jgi:hypothetical protein
MATRLKRVGQRIELGEGLVELADGPGQLRQRALDGTVLLGDAGQGRIDAADPNR